MKPLIINPKEDQSNPGARQLAVSLKEYARNLYETRQLLCYGSGACGLEQGVERGIDRTAGVSMAAPFCVAMGDSGCLCGALSGAVLGAGLFIGNSHPYCPSQGDAKERPCPSQCL